MAYEIDDDRAYDLRRRIKEILNEKMEDPEYTGGQYIGGEYMGYGRKKRRKRERKIKNPNRVSAGKKAAKNNKWINFYTRYVEMHKDEGKSGKQLAKEAAECYRCTRNNKKFIR